MPGLSGGSECLGSTSSQPTSPRATASYSPCRTVSSTERDRLVAQYCFRGSLSASAGRRHTMPTASAPQISSAAIVPIRVVTMRVLLHGAGLDSQSGHAMPAMPLQCARRPVHLSFAAAVTHIVAAEFTVRITRTNSQSCTVMSTAIPDLKRVVQEIADDMRRRPDRGEVATYIPELARADRQCLRPRRDRR